MSADWKKIKAEYIAGGSTLKKLAEKYGITENVIRKRACKEKWNEDRHKTGTKVAQKITEKVAQKCAEKASDHMELAIDCADQLQEFMKKIIECMKTQPEIYAADPGLVKSMSGALKDNIDNLHRVYRILGAAEERRLKIEEEKMKLEREKWEAEQKAAADPEGSMVTVKMDLPEGVSFG